MLVLLCFYATVSVERINFRLPLSHLGCSPFLVLFYALSPESCRQHSTLSVANEASNADVVGELTKLTGVGRKVADCVALFSLDRTSLVPVDTHVWQMALRYMDDTWTGNEKSSLTAKRYPKPISQHKEGTLWVPWTCESGFACASPSWKDIGSLQIVYFPWPLWASPSHSQPCSPSFRFRCHVH